MAYFSNLEKKIDNNPKKPKLANSKVTAIILIVIATIGYFSLFTNLVGFLKYFLLGTMGIFSYALFLAMYVFSGMFFKNKRIILPKKYIIAAIFALLSIISIFHMAFSGGVNFSSYGAYLGDIYNMQVSVGGLFLGLIIYPLQKFLNFGAYILFVIVLIVCVTVIYNGVAEAKSMSKIDFKIFKKKEQPAETQNVSKEKQPESTRIIPVETNETLKEKSENESVGLDAELTEEEKRKQIARQKLGLDRINEINDRTLGSSSPASQLDTFNRNYMNPGASVFTKNSYPDTDTNMVKLSGTFGYSTFKSPETKQNVSQSDQEKYNEYRRFMGLEPIDNEYKNAFSSATYNTDDYTKHDSTETNDERLFGAPNKTEEPKEEPAAGSTKIQFNYSSPSEKVEYLDKLAKEKNEEVKLDNVETKVEPENNLKEIFDNNIPTKKEIELPKSFQTDMYNYNKKFDTTNKNPIDTQINKMKDYSKPVEPVVSDQPRHKIKPYKYTKPTLDLLQTASTDPSQYGGNVEETGHKIESVLEEFKIPAKVIGITRGPAVTRYELEMPVGISVNKIPALANDIAMRIATTKRIMIQAPIPGMSAFGIEVPNDVVAVVSLKDIISSEAFINNKSPCSFGLGKEINGVTDICAVNKMPHVLIAGGTGSGKSVCLNSLIISILYKSSPEDVKFILIDPKRVEFSMYAKLPHLIIPDIISEARKADNALSWAIKEMERRYTLLEQNRVKNIEEYNNLQDVKDRYLPKMPYIIIIMDEFADIMQECKDVESKVIRLAAKARASGIHLVLATQRPSVDILSGSAKTNFPARIAFALTTQIDSRTILDSSGAENLLGRGDMLYVAPGGSNEGPKRLQGCYVDNDEVKAVVDFVITHNEPDFDEGIETEFNKEKEADSVNPDGTFASYNNDGQDEEAEMQEYARNVMREFIRVGKASASYIQRTQRVGFVKAGRIMDYLEKKKYIAPGDGTAKARAVYMTKQQYIEIFGDTDFDNYD